MLNFFMCWTDSDPIYQDYYPDCNILISLVHVAQSWNIGRFSVQPKKIMIDSGAFNLMSKPEKAFTQAKVFNQQLKLARGSNVPTIICHLDNPIPPNLVDTVEVYRKIETTLANAHEFMHLFKAANLSPNFKSLGVIQGNSYDTITFCAGEMIRMGFDYLGLGSLVPLYNTEPIIERVQAAAHVVGTDLHVFGISGIETCKKLMQMGIHSFDSSRPMRAAMYQTLLYSNPMRSYAVGGAKLNRRMRTLKEPLPCECPICKKDPTLIFRTGKKVDNNMRALHNYYHLRKELEDVYNYTKCKI